MSVDAAPGEEEGPLGRAYDARLLRRLLGHLSPYRLQVALAVVVLLAASALELLEPVLTKVAIDRYISTGDPSGLPWLAGLYLLVLVGVFGLRYLEDYLTARIGQRVSRDLRLLLFRHLQRLHLRFFDRTPVGRLMTRVVGDVDALNELFTSGVVAVFGDLFLLVGIVAAMLLLDWRLALAAYAVLPGLVAASLVFRVKVREAFRQVRGRVARVNAFLQEEISGMSVVRLFRREGLDRARFERLNAEHRDAHLRAVFYHAVYYPVIEVLGALSVGLLVWKGGGLLLAESVTLGVLVAFIQYAKRFFQPIMDLSEKYNILQSAMASSERIFELLDTPVEVQPPSAPRPLPPGRLALELDRVWFAYEGEDWVLRDVSLAVPAGGSVAVVGATGSGKTTLANLLLRFYDVQRGAARVGGIDVRELAPRELRRRVAYVQQDVFLFSGTLLENLRLGSDATDDGVREAARAVGLERLIERLPQGWETRLGERGVVLSTGEKQLVALARALVFAPDVLLLDEATSSVDTRTEARLQEAVRRLAAGRTTLVIAHRLSTVRDADAIVVLHRGRVREVGRHDELLAQDGIYRRLFELQFGSARARAAVAAGGEAG